MVAYRFTLFGGLQVMRDAFPVLVGPRKRGAVLAQLLLAGGRTVTAGRLIAGVWGDNVPESADATLQSHVSALRRALEPDRAARGSAQVLVTRGSGYAVVAPRESVDVWRFTDAVEQGHRLHAAERIDEAAAVLREPLREYAALLPDFEGFPFHDDALQHLERLQRAALEITYDLRLQFDEERLAAADLESAARRHPLDEGLTCLLAVARYRAGSQSGALRVLADSRRALATELGIDPSPRLRQLEHDVLGQAAYLDRPPYAGEPPPAPQPSSGRPASPVPAGHDPDRWAFVGRLPELAVLQDALTDATTGRDAVVLVEGHSGIGKTTLLSETADRARVNDRFRVLWGSCAEGAEAPSMWPWMQVVREALELVPELERNQALGSELGRFSSGARSGEPALVPDAAARFRLFDAAAGLLQRVAAQRPLVIVLDDLQWADAASLGLTVHIASRRAPGIVLLAAVRTDLSQLSDEFGAGMAALARSVAVRRLTLGALSREEVGELLRRRTGVRPRPDLVGAVESRSQGNPFYVCELSHLLRDGHDVAGAVDVPAGVPVGVRDVVRARLAGLGASASTLLQFAALIGKRVDLEVLSGCARLPLEDVLTALAPAEALRLLEPVRDDPFCVAFAHDLTREAIAETVPPSAERGMHLRIADALEGARRTVDRSERLAFHLWSAGPLVPRSRTAAAFVDAGQASLEMFAYEAAERSLGTAVELARAGDDPVLELRALQLQTSVIAIVHRYVDGPPALLEHAQHRAAALGYRREEADFLFTRWSIASQYVDVGHASVLAARLGRIADESGDPLTRLYAEHADGLTSWDRGQIGDAYRAFARGAALLDGGTLADAGGSAALRPDLRHVLPAFLAHLTALHVSLPAGVARFDALKRVIGDDRYGAAVWGAVAATSAAVAGDPAWALRVSGERAQPDAPNAFEFVSVFGVFFTGWARALSGEPVQGVACMRATIAAVPDVDALSGYPLWLTLLAEALLVGGRLADVQPELDAADGVMARTGQRYAAPLTLLVRARLAHARGESAPRVRELLRSARELAQTTEATLLVDRIDRCTRTLAAVSR